MLKTQISNGIGNDGYAAEVDSDGFVSVRTKNYYTWENKIISFTNPTYGDDLTINAAVSATGDTEYINNGNDDTYWTLTIISSFPNDFVYSTDQNHTEGGTQSVSFVDSEDGDVGQFARPGGVFNLGNYVTLSGWIYITDWDQTGTKDVLIYGWNTVTGLQVGLQVDIGDYVVTTNLNSWQRFIIPLSDMNLVNADIDAIRIQMVDVGIGGTPEGYLDDLQFDPSLIDTEGPQSYELNAIKGKILEVQSISFCMVFPHDTRLSSGTIPYLSYNEFGDVGQLENGILYRRIQNDIVKSVWIIKDTRDLIKRPYSFVTNLFGDETNTLLNVRWDFADEHMLYYGPRDKLQVNISDDFSDFQHFSIVAACKIRDED